MTDTSKRVMFIMGGTGSIGSAIADQALAQGWCVFIQGSRDSTVDTLVSELQKRYGDAQVSGFAANIQEAGAIERVVDAAVAHFAQINAVVDCLVTGPEPQGGSDSGIVGAFANTNPEAYLRFAELSIVYLQRLAFATLPCLKKSSGCLVTFISDSALFPAPRQALIGAARAASIGFIKNIASEYARDGVRAHCLSLSFVEETRIFAKLCNAGSERIEKARSRAGLGLPTPPDIAPMAVFLCSDGAKRITGQVISINGGLNV